MGAVTKNPIDWKTYYGKTDLKKLYSSRNALKPEVLTGLMDTLTEFCKEKDEWLVKEALRRIDFIETKLCGQPTIRKPLL